MECELQNLCIHIVMIMFTCSFLNTVILLCDYFVIESKVCITFTNLFIPHNTFE